jgi:NAD(P)-dependent dehydrogenase (short-subunit alcohol dehydrogenase family)
MQDPWASVIPAGIPRAALVTGGARRIGRAISLALADAGFAVAIHANASTAEAETASAEIRDRGVAAVVLAADLSREDEVRRLVPAAQAALGPLGVLVNNASTFERDEWYDVTRESWDQHIEPNLRAPFVLMQDFARALPASAEGVVINMLDQRVWALTPHFVSYTVAKAGLWALTQTMALALAPRIRVNAIGPGPTLPSARQTPEQFAKQSASVPLGHGTTPEEIGRAALALLSMRAMTGQMVALDGGQHLQWAPQAGRSACEE